MSESIEDQVSSLERRLDEGWSVCEKAKGESSDDLDRFEDFWIGLLDEYERLYKDLWGIA